ncbi:hypothetical protein [Uliginosibacterium sp. H1]|uniref:hypothetical protein n=1 Tax=Uliginosibacterium sp. H1 TaxID=3114757 RepID=UPI002E178504|nr:hypothetical protein [Uliginosibacterium sp. H1]
MSTPHSIRNAPGSPGTTQAPLGPNPDEEDALDLANEYSFPASDPISISPPEQKEHERELCRNGVCQADEAPTTPKGAVQADQAPAASHDAGQADGNKSGG